MSTDERDTRMLRGPRRAWRRFMDGIHEQRALLHRCCLRLTGDVWDAEDLVQDTLNRVSCTLARSDAPIEQVPGSLVRTATRLWIDRWRRRERHGTVRLSEGHEPSAEDAAPVDPEGTVEMLFEEIARALDTTVGAVKSALSRGRGRAPGRWCRESARTGCSTTSRSSPEVASAFGALCRDLGGRVRLAALEAP